MTGCLSLTGGCSSMTGASQWPPCKCLKELKIVLSIKIKNTNESWGKLLLLTAKSKLDHTNIKNDSFYDMNSKAFSRVFLPTSEKYFQNIKYFTCPWIEPTPVKYRPCILPLSQPVLKFICVKITILLTQHTLKTNLSSLLITLVQRSFYWVTTSCVRTTCQWTWLPWK